MINIYKFHHCPSLFATPGFEPTPSRSQSGDANHSAIPPSSVHINSTNSAAILRMEIKHVAAYYFLRTIMGHVDLRFVGQSSRNMALRVQQPSVLNEFFQNYNILPRSGVRAESLRVRSENMPNFVTFWPTL